MINIRNILHPTDFGENSDLALKHACFMATQFGAELHLINVVQDISVVASPMAGTIPLDFFHDLKQTATEKLSEYPEKVINYDGPVIRNVIEGLPFVEIIQYSKENAIDLIVMGTHGYSGLNHLIIGSVAENVVRKASCPVLTVRSDTHTFSMP